MKNKFFILWIIWTLLGAGLMYVVTASDSNNTIISIIEKVFSLSPLLGFMLALGSPEGSRQFNDWLILLYEVKFYIFYQYLFV